MSEILIFIVSAPAFYLCISKIGGLATIIILSFFPRIIGLENVGKVYQLLIPYSLGMWFSRNDLFTKFFCWKVCRFEKLSSFIKLLFVCILTVFSVYAYFKIDRAIYWDFARGWLALPMLLFFVCYLTRIPGIRSVWKLLGKYSLHIFLLHTFIKSTYGSRLIYGLRYPLLMFLVLLLSSLMLSVLVVFLKKRSESLVLNVRKLHK